MRWGFLLRARQRLPAAQLQVVDAAGPTTRIPVESAASRSVAGPGVWLRVHVVDAEHRPVGGARVLVRSASGFTHAMSGGMPIRVSRDQRDEPAEDPGCSGKRYTVGDPDWLVGHQATLRDVLSNMAATNERTAEAHAAKIRRAATERLQQVMGGELRRLRNLAKRNDAVRPQEILDAEVEMSELQDYIENARIRLDACRLIWRGPSQRGIPTL